MKQDIPVVAIGGSVTLDPKAALEAGFAGVYAITPVGMPLETAMRPDVASENISNTVRNILSHE